MSLLLSIALLLASPAATSQHLDSESEVSSLPGMAAYGAYRSALGRLLLTDRAREVQMLSMPSFRAESAVYIVSTPRGARVISRKLNRPLWSDLRSRLPRTKRGRVVDNAATESRALHDANPQVVTLEAPISAPTGERLRRLWRLALAGARPHEGGRGRDGVTYLFAQGEEDIGYRSGETWSPDKGTWLAALVEVGKHLADYAELPEARRAEAERALAEEADAVAARLPIASQENAH